MIIDSIQIQDFSEREREIIELIAEGLTNREIADRIFLSRHTVKWYIQQLNQKLYTENRDEIVDVAQGLGLLHTNVMINGRPYDNLPQQTTPFIGRDAELNELKAIFKKPETRLLTILGLGGVGKTRLALKLLEEEIGNFEDGIYYVSLQSLAQTEHIIPQIATSIGYQFSSDGTQLRDQLMHYLSTRHLVLLLDNFEHVLDGAGIIHDILQSAPSVKIIVTSREKLNLLSETVYTLSGMTHQYLDMRDDAVQFLLQSAQRVNPNWTISADNRDDIARICRLTEGMPLGILLAVAWLDIYSLAHICDEIQKSADILATEKSDIPERQRSIRAIFDYSWQALIPEEKTAYMKMSVFSGTFSLDALHTIVDIDAQILQNLVNKALLVRHRDSRYSIHELLRQYAEEELVETKTAHTVYASHMQYFAGILRDKEVSLGNEQQVIALHTLEKDFDNIRAMWRWMVAQQEMKLLKDSLEALRMFFLLSNRADIWSMWLSNAIQSLGDESPVELQIYYAESLIELSQIEVALSILKDYEHAIETIENPLSVALALINLSRISYIVGQHEESQQYALDCLQLALDIPSDRYALQAHYGLCLITARQDAQTPLEHIQRCLEIADSLGNLFWMAQAYTLSGLMHLRVGQREIAKAHTQKAYQYDRELGNNMGMAKALNNLAESSKAEGDWQTSESYHQQAMSIARDLGYSFTYAWVLNKLSMMRLIQGDIQGAETFAETSQHITETMDYPELDTVQMMSMSAIAEYQGRFEEAYHLAQEAYMNIPRGLNWAVSHIATDRLAWAQCCLDDYDEAIPNLLQITKQDLQTQGTWHLLTDSALFSMVCAKRAQLERAVEILSLIHHHKIQSPWLNEHPKLRAIMEKLQDELDESVYELAWERGKSMNLNHILEACLAEFSE